MLTAKCAGYSTKSARSGVRISEIFEKETLDRKLKTLAHGFQKRYGDLLKYDVEQEIARFDGYRTALQPFVVDAVPLIESAQRSAETNLLVEGANALMLDVDYGYDTYFFLFHESQSSQFQNRTIDNREP